VEFSEEQYDDVWVAFDMDKVVTIVSTKTAGATYAELVSITFVSSVSEESSGPAGSD
jgi:hypothetical protein